MTVENTNSTISYTGNSSVTTFAYNFLTYSTEHLFIYFDDVLQTSGFTITGIGDDNGGDVTFVSPPTTGVTIRIDRTVPDTQLLAYQEYGPFPAKANERGLDLLTMAVQQTSRNVNRGKMDKRPLAAKDNVVIFDSAGNAKDSGKKLNEVGNGGSYIGENPPTFPQQGDRWTRCTDMKGFIYYVDADSAQWVEDRPSYGEDTIGDVSIPYIFDTVADFKASLIEFPDGKRIEWMGYNAKSDGGSNWGIVTSGTHTDDGLEVFTLADGKYVKANLKGKSINVMKAGAVGVGDETARIQYVFDYVQAQQSLVGVNSPTTIKFGAVQYEITNITVNDLLDVAVNFNGCLIRAVSAVPISSAFYFFNYNNIKLYNLGALYCAGGSRGNYDFGFRFDGGPGGTIDPTFGLAKEMAMTGCSVLRFERNIGVGNETRNTNLGQNSFANCHLKEGGQGIAVYGTQTIVSFVGGSTSGTQHPSYDLADSDVCAVYCAGGVISLTGAEGIKTSGVGFGFILTNCESALYENPYGTILVGNAFVEATKIANIKNIYPTIRSYTSSLRINDCSGFSSTALTSIIISDANYAGQLSLKDSNMYSSDGVVHTQPAVDASVATNCRIDLDERFFNKENYTGGKFGQCLGGIITLNNEEYFKAETLSGTTVTTSGDNLKFQNKASAGRYSRNSGDFSISTGVYTVPSYGILSLTATVNIDTPLTGVIDVKKNGVTVHRAYPTSSNTFNFSCTMNDLVAGDTVEFKSLPNSNVTFSTNARDYVTLSATL